MARTKTPVSEYRKLMLRLPDDIFESVQRLALAHDRSLNSEIVNALRRIVAAESEHARATPAPHPDLAAVAP